MAWACDGTWTGSGVGSGTSVGDTMGAGVWIGATRAGNGVDVGGTRTTIWAVAVGGGESVVSSPQEAKAAASASENIRV